MKKVKTKYTLRADGNIVTNRMYDGKRKYFYGKSDKEIDAKIEAYERELELAKKIRCRTFEQVAEEWWELKQESISPNSINNLRVAKQRAAEYFEDTPIDEITPAEVYAFLKKFAAQGYSQKTISSTKSVVKTIFDNAIIHNEITANPCASVPFVKGKSKVKRKPATKTDIELVEEKKTSSNIARMYYFMLYTGLRRGEAIALQYKHIDFEHKVIHVVQSCAYEYGYKPMLKTPKTEAGIRNVALLENVIEIIPPCDDPETFVFFPEGLPYKTTVERQLKNFRRDTGITSTPHQFRHAFSTMMHAAGVDMKDMQAEMGHSTLAMTMDTYTANDEEHLDNVRQILDDHVITKQAKKQRSSLHIIKNDV